MTLPAWSTWIKSDAFISLNAVPKGFTQNVSGSTGSRTVMCPATPNEMLVVESMLHYTVIHTLVVSFIAEDSECCCEAAF
jgi:hypothetical protein